MEANLLLFLLRTLQLNHLTITLLNNTDYNYKLGMCLLVEKAREIHRYLKYVFTGLSSYYKTKKVK